MERTDNYALQAQSAKRRFLTYDQQKLIAKFALAHDGSYLYVTMLGSSYRLCRKTGDLERQALGCWQDANSFHEVMTLLDMLCDSKEDRYLTGRWVQMQNFGLMFHRNMLETEKDPLAEAFDNAPDGLHRACAALHGKRIPGGDISYAIELFDGLAIGLQFWHSDEDFGPCLRWFWDENALMYIRYETMYYAVGLLKERLRQESLLFC